MPLFFINLFLFIFGTVAEVPDVDCILNCDHESICIPPRSEEAYLHLPIAVSVK